MALDAKHGDAAAVTASQLVDYTGTNIDGHNKSFREEATNLVGLKQWEGPPAVEFLQQVDELVDVHAVRLKRRMEAAIEKLNTADSTFADHNQTASAATKTININFA